MWTDIRPSSRDCKIGKMHAQYELGIRHAQVNSVAKQGPELPSAQLDTWVTWANAQADRIDPVRSGRFIKAMKDPAEEQH